MLKLKSLVLIGACMTSCLIAGPIGVDGTLGAEWNGITPVSVGYNASAPTGNFQTPTNESNTIAYNIYMRSDISYLYLFFEGLPAGQGLDGWNAGLGFANLYFDTDPGLVSGSDVGFEIFNDQAFKPGVPGNYPGLLANGFVVSSLLADYPTAQAAIEIAIPWSYFLTDPQGIGFPTVGPNAPANQVRLNLSQTFGYSVAGGDANYPKGRLGLATVDPSIPEPGTAGLALSALAAGAFWSRRRKV